MNKKTIENKESLKESAKKVNLKASEIERKKRENHAGEDVNKVVKENKNINRR